MKPLINPYHNVNWEVTSRLVSLSHWHCKSQDRFDLIYNTGVRHFPISNYYPSKPLYPLESIFNTPVDALSCPNAEHHGMTNTSLHFNSLGSTYESGSTSGQNPVGVRDTWQNAFTNALLLLQTYDGGGLTINHPSWSNLPFETVKQMMMFDDRVLGLEVYNHTCEYHNNQGKGWSIDYWDGLLSQGIFTLGFFTPDHTVDDYNWGRNVLLVDSINEENALKAYRQGSFFGVIKDNGLTFTEISFNGSTLNVSVSNNATIKFITEKGIIKTSTGLTSFFVPMRETVYVRIEAEDSAGERIFSQPIMYKNEKMLKRDRRKRLLLL